MLHFWLAALWPDPFLPVESIIRSASEFEDRYVNMPEPLWAEHEVILANHPYLESSSVTAAPQCAAA